MCYFSDLRCSCHSNILASSCISPLPQPLNSQVLPDKTGTQGKSKTLSTPSHFTMPTTWLPTCPNPPCSWICFPASQVDELFGGRVVSGWSYIPEPTQLLVHGKCSASVHGIRGWRRLPSLSRSNPKLRGSPRFPLPLMQPVAEVWWSASRLPLMLPFPTATSLIQAFGFAPGMLYTVLFSLPLPPFITSFFHFFFLFSHLTENHVHGIIIMLIIIAFL